MTMDILSPLRGLAGAVSNNGRGEGTDAVAQLSLLSLSAPEEERAEAADLIRQEKFRISPGCASCMSPCGNTSDMDPAAFAALPAEDRARKEALIGLCVSAAEAMPLGDRLPDAVYQVLCCLDYPADAAYYDTLEASLRAAIEK